MANRDVKFKWFRTYADIVDNAKLRLLAFEDRWHFVALCALKCDGLLEDGQDSLLERKIALKLGVQLRELDEIKRRLMEVSLIDECFQPVKWDMRQHRVPDLPEGESLGSYKGYVYFIADDAQKSVKIGYSKNPWARVKDLQTGRSSKLSVVATVRTTDASENRIHKLFEQERLGGEWFNLSPRIQAVIAQIKAKAISDDVGVAGYLSGDVATTKESEPEPYSDREKKEPKGSGAPDGALSIDAIVSEWNAMAGKAGLPKVQKLTAARRNQFRLRAKEYPDMASWKTAMEAISGNPWMCGKNDRGWQADFDFMIQAKSFTKLVEQAYGKPVQINPMDGFIG